MSAQARILLVGFGNMGRALAQGWLARRHAPEAILVVDRSPQARDAAAAMGLTVLDGAVRASDLHGASQVDVVLIAVKPGQIDETLTAYAPLASSAVFLSIAAGKPIAHFVARLGEHTAVVRAMPNTPAAIGRGMTALCANDHVSETQRHLCEQLLTAVGAVAWVDDESLMDAVTAVSGSGPAYVFLLIEAMIAAGVALGLDRALATRLATETVAGAAEYALTSGLDAADLRARVTSPGGTTQAALEVLMGDSGVTELMASALRQAARRSRELSAE